MDLNLDIIVKIIGSLALVVGLLLATLYLMKRQGFSVQSDVEVQSSLSIGPKERILLVKCGQEQILVGATSSNIRTLHIMPKAGADDSVPSLDLVDATKEQANAGALV